MKKLFTNDRFFTVSALLSVLCAVVLIMHRFAHTTDDLAYNMTLLMIPVCTVILYFSYKSYNKNVMKAVMGALLMALLMSDMVYLALGDKIAPLFLTFDALLFFSHLLINSDRRSSPGRIRFNQCVVLAYLLVEIVWTIIGLAGIGSVGAALIRICDALSYLGNVVVIVCVESRLDAYRFDRERAGWTEEKGYPEGYVHQHEKEK